VKSLSFLVGVLVATMVGCGRDPEAARDAGDAALGGIPAPDVSAPDAPAAPDVADDASPDAPPSDARADVVRDTSGDAAPDARADASTGPRVDRTAPQLYRLTFRANEADTAARVALGTETAFLDTRAAPRGRLVVYLHGAGAPTTCGSNEHGRLLAAWGFHVLGPCYVSDYGVGNCGSDIGGCRLEAFEGVDHHPFITIAPADSIERRVVRALQLLQRRNPAGDWAYYLSGETPRWSSIIISGISHGASSAGLIVQVRAVDRAVMLSGPLDTGQAWLARWHDRPRALLGLHPHGRPAARRAPGGLHDARAPRRSRLHRPDGLPLRRVAPPGLRRDDHRRSRLDAGERRLAPQRSGRVPLRSRVAADVRRDAVTGRPRLARRAPFGCDRRAVV